MNDTDVVVVGGGIGGLATAKALAGGGYRVRVLERAPAFTEVGAGLQLAPNATRILRQWDLLDDVIAAGVLPRRLVLKDAVDGTELTSLELGEDFVQRYGAPYVVIHRSDLLAILEDACEQANVELVPNSHVDEVISRADTATAVVGDQRHRAKVVIGADGLWSSLRRKLSDDEPVCAGYVAYRGARPIADVAMADQDALQDVVVYFGPGCHLVQYALRRGEMLNTVAVFASPAYRRGESEWGGPEELDAAFAGTCHQVRQGLAWLWRDRRWPMYDRLPIQNWTTDRFALMGDAAHPMLQYLAQGACQAIEDAYCLSVQIAKNRAGTEPDWTRALAGYQAERAPRTARVQATARSWGELWHCDGLTRSLRNALLTDRDRRDYRYVDWLYLA